LEGSKSGSTITTFKPKAMSDNKEKMSAEVELAMLQALLSYVEQIKRGIITLQGRKLQEIEDHDKN